MFSMPGGHPGHYTSRNVQSSSNNSASAELADQSPCNMNSEANSKRPIPQHDYREGKFPDISSFMTKPACKLLYQPAWTRDLRPGKIIYISDGQGRLDRRIMLILRRRTTSAFTCLTFCVHSESADPRDHWCVCAKGSTGGGGNDGNLTALNIVLQPVLQPYESKTETINVLQDNITINIQDMWNVETGVEVATLGYVDHPSMRHLAEEVKKLFCESVDDAVSSATAEPMRRVGSGEGQSERPSPPKSPRIDGKVFVRRRSSLKPKQNEGRASGSKLPYINGFGYEVG